MSAATLESPPSASSRSFIPSRLLDVEDVAELIHVSTGTIREWVRGGTFPRPMRCGRLLRWEPESIKTWLASRG
jgi:excisionase family DNA binding protein